MENEVKQIASVDWIAIISCIIAVASAIFTFVQARISKKEYKLQRTIYLEGKSKIDLTIRERFLFDDKESDSIYFFFGVNISNLSDKQTSIKKYILSLVCDSLAYKPDFYFKEIELYKDLSRLEIPKNIDSHSAIAGWCVFSILRENYKKLNVNSYILEIEDIHGANATEECYLLREELKNYEI